MGDPGSFEGAGVEAAEFSSFLEPATSPSSPSSSAGMPLAWSCRAATALHEQAEWGQGGGSKWTMSAWQAAGHIYMVRRRGAARVPVPESVPAGWDLRPPCQACRGGRWRPIRVAAAGRGEPETAVCTPDGEDAERQDSEESGLASHVIKMFAQRGRAASRGRGPDRKSVV